MMKRKDVGQGRINEILYYQDVILAESMVENSNTYPAQFGQLPELLLLSEEEKAVQNQVIDEAVAQIIQAINFIELRSQSASELNVTVTNKLIELWQNRGYRTEAEYLDKLARTLEPVLAKIFPIKQSLELPALYEQLLSLFDSVLTAKGHEQEKGEKYTHLCALRHRIENTEFANSQALKTAAKNLSCCLCKDSNSAFATLLLQERYCNPASTNPITPH